MKRYVMHIYRLLMNKEFREEIINFREKWHELFHSNQFPDLNRIKKKPPVDFNDKEIDYLHPNNILDNDFFVLPKHWDLAAQKHGLKKYQDYLNITKAYKGIGGYSFKNNKIYVNKDNTTKKIYREFINLLNKYNFPFLVHEINFDFIYANKKFEELPVEHLVFSHPLYYFLSSLSTFKIEYFLGKPEDIKNKKVKSADVFDPKDFLLYNLNISYFNINYSVHLFTQYQNKQIIKLLEDNNYSKQDILNRIENGFFLEGFKKEFGYYLDNLPNLYLTTGEVQNTKNWDMIYDFLKLKGDFKKGSHIPLDEKRKRFIMNLNNEVRDKTYQELGLDKNRCVSNMHDILNDFN